MISEAISRSGLNKLGLRQSFTIMDNRLSTTRIVVDESGRRQLLFREAPQRTGSGWDELDLVCYAISHDLRAPLRAIDSSAKLLRASLEQRLDSSDAARFQMLIQAGQREARMLDGLLLLCRIARMELRVQEMDVTQLANGILAELAHAEPSRNVRLEIAPDLFAFADRRLLEIALRHLLDNAWKFTRKQKEACITVGAGKLEGRLVLFVRDNGVGFDATQAGRLFGVFERLETAAEFPGWELDWLL